MREIINKIDDRHKFTAFLKFLITDLKNNPAEWENKSLADYLEAMASWTEDMEGYYKNNNLPVPNDVDWKVFANILIAAKMYE